jgi:hypothetical protein
MKQPQTLINEIFTLAQKPEFIRICADACRDLDIMTANEWNNDSKKKVAFVLAQAKNIIMGVA